MKDVIIPSQAQVGLTLVQIRSRVKLTPGTQQELWRLQRTLLEQGSFVKGAKP